MSLVTRCPKCNSDFVVKSEELRLHDGLVRCGSCTHIFDGFAALQNALPTLTQRPVSTNPSKPTLAPLRPLEPTPAPISSPRSTSGPISPPFFGTSDTDNVSRTPVSEPMRARPLTGVLPLGSAPASASDSASFSATTKAPAVLRHRSRTESLLDDTVDEPLAAPLGLSIQGESRLRGEGVSVGRTQPEFLVDEVDTQRLKVLLWGLASALALAMLVMQLAYVYRNDLATQMPSFKPMLETMCSTFKCEVSLRRQIERISVSVIAFERQASAEQESKPVDMTLKFSMRNRLNLAQPWPSLSLELTDASGTVVLRKLLSPREYLPTALADKPFAAGQDVTLNVPIKVMGLQINGYSLKPFFP